MISLTLIIEHSYTLINMYFVKRFDDDDISIGVGFANILISCFGILFIRAISNRL